MDFTQYAKELSHDKGFLVIPFSIGAIDGFEYIIFLNFLQSSGYSQEINF